MVGELIVIDALKLFFLITSPLTFLAGLFLLYDLDTYQRIEKFLGKNFGLFKKTLANQLERNRESFQLFLLKRRRIVGVVCLLNSIMAVFVSLMLLRRS